MGPLDPAELTEEEDGQVIKVSGQAADAETPGGVPWPATERARAQREPGVQQGAPSWGQAGADTGQCPISGTE